MSQRESESKRVRERAREPEHERACVPALFVSRIYDLFHFMQRCILTMQCDNAFNQSREREKERERERERERETRCVCWPPGAKVSG